MRKLVTLCLVALAGLALATVPNETRTVSYACNGSQTVYPYTFKLLSSADLVVTTTAPATLALTTDYAVSGVGAANGGNVTLVAGSRCANGQTITITRTLADFTQKTSFRSQGSYTPAVHENALDKLSQATIELKSDLADALNVATTSDRAYASAASAAASAAIAAQAAFDAAAAVSAAAVPGSATLITAAGSTTPRTAGARFGETANAKDFGAKGDGVTDDTAAIQAAITFGSPAPSVYLPCGTYKVTAPIQVTNSGGAPATWVRIYGAGECTKVTGNFSGAIFSRTSLGGVPSGTHSFENMQLVNANANGICVQYADAVNVKFSRLFCQPGKYGFDVSGQGTGALAFTNVFDNVQIAGAPTYQVPATYTAIGILTYGHTSIFGGDITSCAEGIRASGSNLTILGTRFEVNKIGINLGQDAAGGSLTLSRFLIGGLSMEANDLAIQVYAAADGLITGLGHQGSVGSPSAGSIWGLKIINATDVTVQNVIMNGRYAEAACLAQGPSVHLSFNGAACSNDIAGTGRARAWDVRMNLANLSFVNSNYDARGRGDSDTVSFALPSLSVGGISAANAVDGNVAAKNLRGHDLTVNVGVTSLAVAFPLSYSGGAAAFATLTAANAGGSLSGTFYYCPTLVNDLGESACNEQSLAIGGGNNAATMTFYGVSGSHYRRRVYRGTAAGVYDGYYDLPIGYVSSFTDTGAAFTGIKSPPIAGTATPSGAEADASYAVACTPQWDAKCWVTSKATTGFTLNFDPAPVSTTAADWVLIR